MFIANTSHPDCPVRIMYIAPDDIDRGIHASRMETEPFGRNPTPIAVIRCTEYSDYSGSTVEMSNRRLLLDQLGDQLIEVYGSHGYAALAYDATLGPVPADADLVEILDGIESDPAIDDDDVSYLEDELEGEAWDDDGCKDFRKALGPVLAALDAAEHDLDDVTDEDLTDLWYAGCEALGVNGGSGVSFETGGSVYFHIDDWVAKAARTEPGEMRTRLVDLAVASRVA